MEIKGINILIVEDEGIVALDIENALKNLGIKNIAKASSYDEALQLFEKQNFHILITDINLQQDGLDGISLAKELVNIKDISIIFITAYNNDKIISEAVKIDPIGYLNKPFNRDDLKPLIHLVSHKLNTKLEQQQVHLKDGYYIDFASYDLYHQDEKIKLNAKEMVLLKTLYQNVPNVVPFVELEYKIWNDKEVSSSALRTLIYRLRSKVSKDMIETISNLGVRLNISSDK